MEIRLAYPNEVEQLIEIFQEARTFLAQSGSPQWQGRYPGQEDIYEDILSGRGYVAQIGGEIAAYAAVCIGNEPAYNEIYDGKWQHNHAIYTTFHCVVVAQAFREQQVAQTFLQGLIEGQKGPDFRCDTHEENHAMRHILEKLGFCYCGKVPIDGERLAYQKIKTRGEKSLYQEITEEERYLFG